MNRITILDQIAASTKKRVEQCKQKESQEEVCRKACSLPVPSGFPFEEALRGEKMSFICEIKKASPSKGLIADCFPYKDIAREYQKAGAECISVLTEPDYFQGSIQYLKEIHETVETPLLRKDFTVDEYMIYEAKLMGASAVLLICSLLSEDTLRNWIQLCDRLGLSALVETHNEVEIDMAIRAGARIIGVNNRDLKTFEVDIHNCLKLREKVPEHIVFVAESGMKTRSDIEELERGGVNAVLIGETLMRSANKTEMLTTLRGMDVKA